MLDEFEDDVKKEKNTKKENFGEKASLFSGVDFIGMFLEGLADTARSPGLGMSRHDKAVECDLADEYDGCARYRSSDSEGVPALSFDLWGDMSSELSVAYRQVESNIDAYELNLLTQWGSGFIDADWSRLQDSLGGELDLSNFAFGVRLSGAKGWQDLGLGVYTVDGQASESGGSVLVGGGYRLHPYIELSGEFIFAEINTNNITQSEINLALGKNQQFFVGYQSQRTSRTNLDGIQFGIKFNW